MPDTPVAAPVATPSAIPGASGPPLGAAIPAPGAPRPVAAEPGPTRAQQVALAALCIALLLLGLWTLHRFVAALAWAGIFAIATWPTYRRVRRRWDDRDRRLARVAVEARAGGACAAGLSQAICSTAAIRRAMSSSRDSR